MAAPSKTQSASGIAAASTTVAATWGAATTAGNCLLHFVSYTGNTAPTGLPTGVTLVGAVSNGSAATYACYKEENASSRSGAQTYTWAANKDATLYIIEFASNNGATLAVDEFLSGATNGNQANFWLEKATRSKSSVVVFARMDGHNNTTASWDAGNRCPGQHATWLGWIRSRANAATARTGQDVGYFLLDDYAYPHDIRRAISVSGAGVTAANIGLTLCEGTPADAPADTSGTGTFRKFGASTLTAATTKAFTLTLHTPTNGDLLVAFLSFHNMASAGAYGTITVPAGWSLVAASATQNDTATFDEVRVYQKIAATEGAGPSYSWSWTNSTLAQVCGVDYGVTVTTAPTTLGTDFWHHFPTHAGTNADAWQCVGTPYAGDALPDLTGYSGLVLTFTRQPASGAGTVDGGAVERSTGAATGIYVYENLVGGGEHYQRVANDPNIANYGLGAVTGANWISLFWGTITLGTDHWGYAEQDSDSWQLVG
jgi:hypothetical protein